MATIHELGTAVHARRSEMGLTQARLAALSGLARQTVNQLENGSVVDLSLNRAGKLAAVLGLSLHVQGHDVGKRGRAAGRMSALNRASRTASTSFREVIQPSRLRKILLEASVSEADAPYLHALLDEAPISLLASVCEQLHDQSGLARQQVWQHLRQLARQVMSKRDIWQ